MPNTCETLPRAHTWPKHMSTRRPHHGTEKVGPPKEKCLLWAHRWQSVKKHQVWHQTWKYDIKSQKWVPHACYTMCTPSHQKKSCFITKNCHSQKHCFSLIKTRLLKELIKKIACLKFRIFLAPKSLSWSNMIKVGPIPCLHHVDTISCKNYNFHVTKLSLTKNTTFP